MRLPLERIASLAWAQAETGGLSLQINVNTLEDEFLLGEIKRREADVLTRAGPIGLGIRRGGQLDKARGASARSAPHASAVPCTGAARVAHFAHIAERPFSPQIGTESAPLSPDKRVVADRDALKDEARISRLVSSPGASGASSG